MTIFDRTVSKIFKRRSLMSEKEIHETKAKILKAAEKLFAEFGFNATSVDKIAKTAGLTKSNIYYHFKSKEEIITSLMINLIDETEAKIQKQDNPAQNIRQEIEEEIIFLNKKKKLLTVMFMEALKRGEADTTLFQCAEMVIKHEYGILFPDNDTSNDKTAYLTYEFFSGFLPLISFVVFQDSFCKYFHCDKKQLMQHFLDTFLNTHFKNHPQITTQETI